MTAKKRRCAVHIDTIGYQPALTPFLAMMFMRTFRRGDAVRLVGQTQHGRFIRYVGDGRAVVEFGTLDVRPIGLDDLRHAPVTVVGHQPKPDPTACPECGSDLFIDAEALRVTPRRGQRPLKKVVRVAACSGCEYVKEVPR